MFLLPSGGWAGLFSSDGQGTRGPAVLKMSGGARALGLGGSYVAVADDASATQWNPAGLQRISEKEVQLMSAQLFAGQRQQSVMYAHPAWRARQRETWGMNVSLLDVDSFDVQKNGERVGSARPQEFAAGVSYAHPLWGAAWGVTGKYVRAETYQQKGEAFDVDVGLMGPGPSDRWSWGVVLSNLGTPLTLGSQEIPPPTALRFGIAWKRSLSSRGTVLLTGQVDGEVKNQVQERAGGEYSFRVNEDWSAAVRAGYQTQGDGQFSAGAGMTRKSITLNYSFQSRGDLGNAGFFDLAIRFGGPLEQEVRRTKGLNEVRALLEEGDVVQARKKWDPLNTLSPKDHAVQKVGRTIREKWGDSLDPAALLAQAQEAFAQGDPQEAADRYRKLLLVVPTHPEGLAGLAKAEKQIEADRRARLNAEVAAQRAQARRDIESRAITYETQGRWLDAVRLWKKYAAMGPPESLSKTHIQSCFEQAYAQAESALAAGKTEPAQTLFLSIDEEGPYRDAGQRARSIGRQTNQQKIVKAQEKYREGRTAYVNGDLKTARRLFEEAVRLDPNGPGYRQALDQVVEELKLSNGSSHEPTPPTRP
jgi:tetratricopeptide (TPR) repeat protein